MPFEFKYTSVIIYLYVTARGLDIPSIKIVINYDVARDIDTHTHRVGRTGRAGEKGTAYTLLTAGKDIDFSAHLVRNLEGANQRVPSEVLDLAMKVVKIPVHLLSLRQVIVLLEFFSIAYLCMFTCRMHGLPTPALNKGKRKSLGEVLGSDSKLVKDLVWAV